MRISFEGHATEAGQKLKGNRLKLLEIPVIEFLIKAVDKVRIHCRIRGLDQGTETLPLLFKKLTK